MENVYGNQREVDLNLAYLAGLVDGEGSISIKHNKVTNVYSATISVGMTQTEGLHLLVEMFGGKIREDFTSNRKSTMYRWQLTSKADVSRVLEALLPYLRVKKDIAVKVLTFYNEGVFLKGGRGTTSVEEQERRKDLYLKVKKLNNVRTPATTNRANNREIEVIV